MCMSEGKRLLLADGDDGIAHLDAVARAQGVVDDLGTGSLALHGRHIQFSHLLAVAHDRQTGTDDDTLVNTGVQDDVVPERISLEDSALELLRGNAQLTFLVGLLGLLQQGAQTLVLLVEVLDEL